MSKKARQSDTRLQLSLLDVLKQIEQAQEAEPGEGSLNIEEPLRLSLKQALKESPLSVHQIAGEMSHLLGETITAEMVYSWTAESKSLHQIWGSRLPAFIRATGSRRPLEIIAKAAGAFTLPGPDALRAEIQHCMEQEKKARAERRKREIVLEQLESSI